MTDISPLQGILQSFRDAAKTEREKGTYFEELSQLYLRHEPMFADMYSDVWMLNEVPDEHGIDKSDLGIDLVAKTNGTDELHAIQCKFYDERLQRADLDGFLAASGQHGFTRRILITTATEWGENAEKVLFDQQPPVQVIDLYNLETSQIDWSKYKPDEAPTLKKKYDAFRHQQRAIDATLSGLKTADRGKLIMACGTGKTFTSLKIAEETAGPGKRVLFLVPSLALLSQTLTEWTQQSKTPLHSFAVCSDSEVGKKRKSNDDKIQTFVHELRYPATTNAARLAEEVKKRHGKHHMSVVFSTYHSIQAVHDAQHDHKLPGFDLVICDEAHRTTGATFESEEESAFVRIHDADFIKAKKRLYMTATPRIYANIAKATAIRDNIALCSMDDEELYGKQLHVITFSEAVELGLLTDYKVLVLTIDQDHVSERLQDLLKDDSNQLKVDDAARIIGCWKALSKQGLAEELGDDTAFMQRAVAFCQVIEPSTGKTHKVSSKQISQMFQSVVDAYQEHSDDPTELRCEARHVDGSMNATEKGEKIAWLKGETDEETCRILCNVRCLSEGVDVPALDSVLFLSPRNSQVEVVQSVGRVMRNAPGKKLGYVVLPVVIPAGMEPHEALNNNKVYGVVWGVLQALRSHDDRFDSFVNKMDLMNDTSGKMEVIAITDSLSPKSKGKQEKTGEREFDLAEKKGPVDKVREFQWETGELEKALYARLVKKCGNRSYWEEWANDIAAIANTHISRITKIIENPKNKKEIESFKAFADELRDDLNDSITNEEVIEMLAQHLITKPVFDALFADYSFASNNPVSKGMQEILDLLQEHRLDKEADTLEQFYASVRRRADGIDKAEGKQKIVVELYDKFFRNAFPRMTERLGIVYTPVEVVDFIIHSVNDILQEEFGQTLGSEGVHILDPFVGTGTFITRLMQSGLITPEQLPHKYKHEIHCNEIVLLAYYIAAINIEAVYHSIMNDHAAKKISRRALAPVEKNQATTTARETNGTGANAQRLIEAPAYEPFQGILLTDTFAMYESDDLIEQFFPDNSQRRKRQKKLDIRVIVGNPPYSAGQESANDNNQNVTYDALDGRIRSTYAANSKMTSVKNLYDSYIRAIRWASDRVGDSGVIGFVTNAGFLEANTGDGLRKCLADEFAQIYVFHLRGNQRTSGELSRKEAGKIFGSGSRAPIAITLLVKRPSNERSAEILWHDIGDYHSRETKLEIVSRFASISGITTSEQWTAITPDAHFDWINQRDMSFDAFAPIGDKESPNDAVFSTYSLGVATGRDAWCHNFSQPTVVEKLRSMIDFYNSEVDRFEQSNAEEIDDFITIDQTKVSWNRNLKSDLKRLRRFTFAEHAIQQSTYRPFTKDWLYFRRELNAMIYQMHRFFPSATSQNTVICVSGKGAKNGPTALISNAVPDLNLLEAGAQCFPMFIYETDEPDDENRSLFANTNDARESAITDQSLQAFQGAYPSSNSITKEDLFYYIYGLLHSPEYRERYKDNLSKELPRIPAVKKFEDFQAFSQAGRDLAHWHLDYETVDCHPVTLDFTAGDKGPKSLKACKDEHLYVRKMKFPSKRDPKTKKSVKDKTTVIYNDYITVRDIPLEAYDYVVNGKPAIEWVMERQAVTTDKKSGITNDANLWATETMNNAAYSLELLMRVITVSLATNRIVAELPSLDID